MDDNQHWGDRREFRPRFVVSTDARRVVPPYRALSARLFRRHGGQPDHRKKKYADVESEIQQLLKSTSALQNKLLDQGPRGRGGFSALSRAYQTIPRRIPPGAAVRQSAKCFIPRQDSRPVRPPDRPADCAVSQLRP